jgi:hypothetical protein
MGLGLTADLDLRIERIVGAVVEPVPHPRLIIGYQHIGFLTERAGKMRRGVAHGHDGVARVDERGRKLRNFSSGANTSSPALLAFSSYLFEERQESLMNQRSSYFSQAHLKSPRRSRLRASL